MPQSVCPCSQCRRPIPPLPIGKSLAVILTVIPTAWLMISAVFSLGA